MYTKCISYIAKFSYSNYVLGLGYKYSPCYKGKKNCLFNNYLFTKYSKLRRALRN
jgi:hypothetical protein